MKDLLFFICFIFIFLCAFSIACWSLLTTTSQIHWNYDNQGNRNNITITPTSNATWSWLLVKNVINFGVWKVFGQIDLIGTVDFKRKIREIKNDSFQMELIRIRILLFS